MSNSVINQKPFSGVNSSQTPHQDSNMQGGGQDGSLSVTMKTKDQQWAAENKTTIDSHPAFSFSLWWERWRREARTRFPIASIKRHS
jgi:hypothetical protein